MLAAPAEQLAGAAKIYSAAPFTVIVLSRARYGHDAMQGEKIPIVFQNPKNADAYGDICYGIGLRLMQVERDEAFAGIDSKMECERGVARSGEVTEREKLKF